MSSGFSELFEAVDARHRIFMRSLAATPVRLDFGSPAAIGGVSPLSEGADRLPVWNALDVQREADRVLLSRFAPVGVVVDETMTVLQFRGRTAAYLEPPPGIASLDLFRMLREGLLAEVRSATSQAKAENIVVTRDRLLVRDGSANACRSGGSDPIQGSSLRHALLSRLVPGFDSE